MSYIVTKTDGNVLATVLDGTTNSDIGITLIGRNYTSYGQVQNDNFVRLLENFADTIPPGQSVGFSPIAGTLWWDTGNQILKVYDGANFIPVSQRTVANTAPTITHIGDQWWDYTNQQLFVWSGASWLLVGPVHTIGQGKSGALVEYVTDNFGANHVCINSYTNGNLISITSYDTFMVGTTIPGFPVTIASGINLSNVTIINGTASNSNTVGGIDPAVLARVDTTNTFEDDTYFEGNIVLNNANLFSSTNSLVLQNKASGGNVDVFVNTVSNGNVRAFSISGQTGHAYVSSDPIYNHGIANKEYVDTSVAATITLVNNLNNETEANVNQVLIDYQGNIITVINATNANLSSAINTVDNAITNLTTEFVSNMAIITANLAADYTHLGNLDLEVANLAPIVSPVFGGNPTAPQTSALLNYFSSLGPGLNPYAVSLTSNISVAEGDVISQLDSQTLVTLANLTVYASTVGNVIPCIVSFGSITQGTQPFRSSVIEINGVLAQPANYITDIEYLGPVINYHGVGDYSNTISTTMYVDTTANIIFSDYTTRISNLNTVLLNDIATAVAPLAPAHSPTFTGVPQAPTPTAGNNSSTVATTAFVEGEIASVRSTWMGSKFTVSTAEPTGGNDGDFWFVIG